MRVPAAAELLLVLAFSDGHSVSGQLLGITGGVGALGALILAAGYRIQRLEQPSREQRGS
ncbi:hypothetical protein E6W39_23695 [Kitasatospora acidiphila]|uniref:Uncharacterized protein n=1 Tax=Kitasatospora acidiphila TaxID=2567942 RepID=A0A540W6M5_9ACTN|nr:hypothetical protein [Kitasatospora acidiphila]TQF04675.1 hypothetical protein E6W39_23695 [Kitasatospora acidiphila]